MSDYTPIPCAIHSEYELLAMHRSSVEIICSDKSTQKGKVIDIVTSQGAEYLVLETADGQQQRIRLDHIFEVKRLG
ncbi:MAG: Rho-binding antiterminator [Chromatiales bacterium]|nr:Rho-binding antiterminator [Chromatiales bacterium]